MLTNTSIVTILRETGLAADHSINVDELSHVESNRRHYTKSELPEFKRDLVEAGNQSRVIYLEYSLSASFAWPL